MTDTPPADPADHAQEFAERWADKLDQYAAERMEYLGIPPEQLGTSDHATGVAWRAFFPRERAGGNVTVDGRINIDSGVLNPELLDEPYGESATTLWEKSRLRDRMDAVIVHEEAEHCEGDHAAALNSAPETSRPVSDRTRAILVAMRDGRPGHS